MILQRVNRDDAEKVFIAVKNTTGGAVSAGYLACFNLRNINSANGIDIEKPATSALPAFAGVVTDTEGWGSYSIADTDYGLAQVYGYNDLAYVRFESTDGNIAAGDIYGPVNGQWYANSNGTAHELGPLIILSQHTAATAETRHKVFIRAL